MRANDKSACVSIWNEIICRLIFNTTIRICLKWIAVYCWLFVRLYSASYFLTIVRKWSEENNDFSKRICLVWFDVLCKCKNGIRSCYLVQISCQAQRGENLDGMF